ncbi:unnamed protein product [Blepharisma stoltei]|uniref:Pentatricopeptide repeat-containing protein n=1 Tax=Blepharisma stoltei TaxID=1481888 RepID=A0AAU9KAV9_9CILI|nr:unnamed protein product [Blepharisma stoltei]
MSKQAELCDQTPFELISILNELIDSENFDGMTIMLQELEEAGYEKFHQVLLMAFQRLINRNFLTRALDLFTIFPILCYYEKSIEGFLADCLFDSICSGNEDKIKNLIDCFGNYTAVTNASNYNLFEYAVVLGKFEMAKMIRETLGVTSNEGFLLIRAARLGKVEILEYLWKEIGMYTTQTDLLLRYAIKSGSLDTLKFIRFEIGIVDYRESEILEIAIYQAIETADFNNLEFLLVYFKMNFNPKKILPMGDTEPPPKHCLYESMCKLAVMNDTDFIRYCYYVLKIDFATCNPKSEWATYLDLLKISVKNWNLKLLKILIEELGLVTRIIPDVLGECLIFYILQFPGEAKDKRKFLDYYLKYETKDNLRSIKDFLTPEMIAMLQNAKMKSSDAYSKKAKYYTQD